MASLPETLHHDPALSTLERRTAEAVLHLTPDDAFEADAEARDFSPRWVDNGVGITEAWGLRSTHHDWEPELEEHGETNVVLFVRGMTEEQAAELLPARHVVVLDAETTDGHDCRVVVEYQAKCSLGRRKVPGGWIVGARYRWRAEARK